jgi:hypothetical protein
VFQGGQRVFKSWGLKLGCGVKARVERVANKIEILFKKREERKDGKEWKPRYMEK